MKRMYYTLSIFLLVIFWAITGFGQKQGPEKNRPMDHADSFQKRFQLREEMHRRLMDKLLRDVGPDENLFSDLEQLMDESMSEAFGDMNSFGSITLNPGAVSSSYESVWKEDKTGRTLVITPKDPSQQLDINVQKGLITIKGKQETKNQFGSSLSSFSNSFSIPADVDGSKVKISQKGGKILVKMPYKSAAKEKTHPSKDERIPIPPSEDDVTI